jgi:beta-N-acetylhexosaminidase
MKFQKHKALILSMKGERLLEEERELFAREKPLGFILFSRNIKNKAQVKDLVKELRDAVDNEDAPIFLDQEGGRVARLKEPLWYHPLPAATFGKIAEQNLELAKEACKLNAQLIAYDMINLGININCAPMVDILQPYSDNVIGDRSYGADKHIVTELARAMADGLLSGGVQPIIKHIPGHGRAKSDSHLTLPEVHEEYKELQEVDFYPFTKLNHYYWAMTAHVLYTSIDPEQSATLSKKVIKEIRETIGFKGLLVSDCITMKALKGSMKEKALSAFQAGCDIVIYSGISLEEMANIMSVTPNISLEQEILLQASYSQASEHQEDFEESIAKTRLLEILETTDNYMDRKDLLCNNFDPTEQLQKNFS